MNDQNEKRKNLVYEADTNDGRLVTNLRWMNGGWVGAVNGKRMVWNHEGASGMGVKWNLCKVRLRTRR
jgi:hypothetical protein